MAEASGIVATTIGISTIHPSIAPQHRRAETFGPTMYPTPRSAGETSNPIAPRTTLTGQTKVSGIHLSHPVTNFTTAAAPSPKNTFFACFAPASPARSTSAQASPSG